MKQRAITAVLILGVAGTAAACGSGSPAASAPAASQRAGGCNGACELGGPPGSDTGALDRGHHHGRRGHGPPPHAGRGRGRDHGGPDGRGRGHVGGGGPPSGAMRGDFHALLDEHARITRRVELTPDGAETWTTSDDPEVAATIARHVSEMRDHVGAGGRVRMWDPLFRAMLAHADEMTLEVEPIDGGVHVIHRGATPRAVELIQAHARVVDGFVARGRDEAHREHPAPR